MIPDRILFNAPNDIFEVSGVEIGKTTTVINLISRQNGCQCHRCGSVATHLHSYYYRKIRDLPAFDRQIILRLRARKFYCANRDCGLKIFTERFNDHFSSHQRNSDRLNRKLLKIALLVGGNSGARLCATLNIAACSSTLLRQIHRQPLPEVTVSDTVGIDDWAFRKGVSYGTAIVDLKKRRVVDLLPDRDASTVEAWLNKRPHIKVVTRDRYSHYARAVRSGLPHAEAVADRWHLIKNLGDALQKVLIKSRQELRRANRDTVLKQNDMIQEQPRTIIAPSKAPQSQRDILLAQAKNLHQQGIPIRQIAKSLHMSRVTVRKYLRLQDAPRKNEGKTNIYKFFQYLQKRMNESPNIEVIQLWKEVVARGYTGSRSTFYHHLKDYVKPNQRVLRPSLHDVSWLPSKVCIMLYKKQESLSSQEKRLLKSLKSRSVDIRHASVLTEEFRQMLESKNGTGLKSWVEKVNEYSVPELKGFANSLLNDYEAVKNAIKLSWSNGPVEGHVNKLKTIKRQMYGRAGFSLLRKKVVLGYD